MNEKSTSATESDVRVQQGLRLQRAFFRIEDSDEREKIIAVAELAALACEKLNSH